MLGRGAPVSPDRRTLVEVSADSLRTEIQAMRALAVGVVVLYHLWPDRLPGGYVGVDVFFVISGYLITGSLAAEVQRSGRLRVAHFWARRARRLVPASSLMLAATSLGILVLVPLAQRGQFFGEVVSSAGQFENWRLAHDAVDYLAANNARSPVQHFWSLSTEEQFYLAVPLLLVTLAFATRHRPERRAPALLVALGLICLGSIAWSIHQTGTNPGVAYFSTFTRAWEFGCGALLACRPGAGEARGPGSGRVRQVWPWLGVGAIVVACFAFSDGTPFPGYLAVLPVAGTVLALGSGRGTSLAALGFWAPVALVGRTSYAIYLWHLPLIVLLPYATGRPLDLLDKLGVLAVTGVVATASTMFLEEPVRFRKRWLAGRRPRVVAAWCAGAVTATIVLGAVGGSAATGRTQQLLDEAHDAVRSHEPCLGAAALDRTPASCEGSGARPLIPDPQVAAEDTANLPECWQLTHGVANVCSVGRVNGYSKRLLAVGDSHNNVFVDVYRRIGEQEGWRVDVAGEGGCYLTAATQEQPSSVEADQCASWQKQMMAVARKGGYDGIIVTHSSYERPVVTPAHESRLKATADGLVAAWDQLPDVPIIAIADNPIPRRDVVDCVDHHRSDAVRRCAQSRRDALAVPDGQKAAALRVPRASVIDLTSDYCLRLTCPPVIGDVVVYRDGNHLTASYAYTLEPDIRRGIVASLGSS